jgi:hypothetical protein
MFLIILLNRKTCVILNSPFYPINFTYMFTHGGFAHPFNMYALDVWQTLKIWGHNVPDFLFAVGSCRCYTTVFIRSFRWEVWSYYGLLAFAYCFLILNFFYCRFLSNKEIYGWYLCSVRSFWRYTSLAVPIMCALCPLGGPLWDEA